MEGAWLSPTRAEAALLRMIILVQYNGLSPLSALIDSQTDHRPTVWHASNRTAIMRSGKRLGVSAYILLPHSFLPRDAMHKRGICCHPVSVRPSVTFVSCAKTNKDILEIFSPSGSQAILVFARQTEWRCSDGNPLNGGVECKGVWKNDDFRPISRSIWETVRPIVRWAHSAR